MTGFKQLLESIFEEQQHAKDETNKIFNKIQFIIGFLIKN